MANLFQTLNGNQRQMTPMNQMGQIVQAARQMRQTLNGNPRQMVEQLVASGQMSQQQFNQYAQIASQIVNSGAFK